MLIVSDFHDYYDTCSRYGIDKSIVYKRDVNDIVVGEGVLPPFLCKFIRYKSFYAYTVDVYCILFCNQFYPLIKITEGVNGVYCYSHSDIDNFFLSHPKLSRTIRGRFGKPIDALKYFDAYAIKQLQTMNWVALHRRFNSPILFIEQARQYNTFKIIINPMLRQYNFQRVKDPFTAFQDIQSFLSGVMGNTEREIITVDNDTRIAKHGFDKWSFRKPPQSC